MNIYVAAKWEEKSHVRLLYKVLTERGHVITHDWTQEEEGDRQGEELEKYLRDCADKDYEGVMAADVVILVDHPRLRGGMVELGLALAWGKTIYVLKNGFDMAPVDCIFYHMPEIRHLPGIEDILKELEDVAP